MLRGQNPYQSKNNYFIDLSIILFSVALGTYSLFFNRNDVSLREDKPNLGKKISDGERIEDVAVSNNYRR